ncbi:M15 family metallopeptidase [Gordonia caeni]|uniref:Peptidase M15C domain-containing protein n=1 Tax=Gordonia caeni TaxID=1007097 RepID=A0ABP7PDB3_9ACTN
MSFRTIYGLTTSENGWRMVNRDGCVVTNPVPNSNTAPVRAGDAATVLNAWLIWYHRNVEPVSSPVWGWSATNDVASSNHLSGTALDINAPKYPWGARVMPTALKNKVREGLRLFEGNIFWGADWSRADEMHYQLNGGTAAGTGPSAKLSAFAKKLNNGHLGIYKAAPAVPMENKIDTEAKIAAKWIGKRLHDGEKPCKDGVGRYADFEHGSIYWHPDVHRANGNAIAVPAHIYETWASQQWEQGWLGYPVRRHTVVSGVGDIQAFQGGTIYRRYGEPGYAVRGVIGQRWAAEGFETGPLGWPTSDERDNGTGGRVQDFEGGQLSWDPSGAVKAVKN